jgi:hypothetical protein
VEATGQESNRKRRVRLNAKTVSGDIRITTFTD